jgi:hypothetical protein
MVRPKLDAPQITIAENQEGFKPVTAALVHNQLYPAVPTEHGPLNTVVVAFRPDEGERARLAAGEDIYISLLTFLNPMQGIIVSAGSEEPAALFNVKVEP